MAAVRRVRDVTAAVRVLDMSRTEEFTCVNLMCEKVGGLCLCRFSAGLPKLRGLQQLRARHNRLDRWPEVWELSALELLDLGSNHLSTLPEALSHMPALTHVNLDDNLVQELPAYPIGRVRSLSLRGNRIQRVPDALLGSRSLALLDLTDNPVESVSARGASGSRPFPLVVRLTVGDTLVW